MEEDIENIIKNYKKNITNAKRYNSYINEVREYDGYIFKEINSLELSEEKWQLYNRFYAFRIYTRMLIGKINRDSSFEEYLKEILLLKNDRVTEWIKKYNTK